MTPKEELGRKAFEKMVDRLTPTDKEKYAEAGKVCGGPSVPEWEVISQAARDDWIAIAEFIVAEEREACAVIADGYQRIDRPGEIGAEIRARATASGPQPLS